MASRKLLLGIDIGTSAVKALLVDAAGGRVAAAAQHDVASHSPLPLWSEQHPHDWERATLAAITAAIEIAGGASGEIVGVGITGQMHGLVALDAAGDVLRPAILWNDQRTADQCAELTRRIGAARVIEITGNPILTGFTAPKIQWLRDHEPDAFRRIAHVMLPKDYVRYRLCGEMASDVSDASGTSLLNVRERRWSDEMRDAVGLHKSCLPPVHESPTVVSLTRGALADACGLRDVPIVAGAGDQAAQAVGVGLVAEGAVSATIGTSGVVFAVSERYRVDPHGRLHAFCHAVPGQWHLMGVMLSAGGSLRWYRDALCDAECRAARESRNDAYDLLTAAAATIPAGAEGLLFLPYLSGERTPHADPHARGALVGLTLRHTKAHITRAILEGITFGLCDSLQLMRELGVAIRDVRASGGGATSAFWRQLLADVFNAHIFTTDAAHGAAYGAAILAAVGVGACATVADACKNWVRASHTAAPESERARQYADIHRRYRALYPALAGVFHEAAQANAP